MKLHLATLFLLMTTLAACQSRVPQKSPHSAPVGNPHPQANNQPPVSTAPIQKGPQIIPLEYTPGSLFYPKEWGEQGVQGEVIFSGQIKPDGFAEQVVLKQSSGNGQLDQNALGLVQKAKFRLEKRRSVTEPEPVEIRLIFRTVPFVDFWKKTCGQFIKEVDYFKKTFPNKPESEVMGYHELSGIALLHALNKTGKFNPNGNTFAGTVEFCHRHSDYLLLKYFMENHGVNFNDKHRPAG